MPRYADVFIPVCQSVICTMRNRALPCQVGAWSYPLLTWLGLGLTGISFVAAPLAAGWCALSLWLGRRQVTLAKQRKPDAP
jgi:hypothetical protein